MAFRTEHLQCYFSERVEGEDEFGNPVIVKHSIKEVGTESQFKRINNTTGETNEF